jgi:hypothetical protein
MVVVLMINIPQLKTISLKISDMKLNLLARSGLTTDEQEREIGDFPISPLLRMKNTISSCSNFS